MTQAALPLTALSEAQRTQALERLEIIRPAVEKHISTKSYRLFVEMCDACR